MRRFASFVNCFRQNWFYVFLTFSVIFDTYNDKNEWIFNTWSMFSKTGPIPVCDKSFDKTPLSSLLSGCLNSCGINSKHSDILKKKRGGYIWKIITKLYVTRNDDTTSFCYKSLKTILVVMMMMIWNILRMLLTLWF